jgi:1-deoxyxylulose-5-phosphate synthase
MRYARLGTAGPLVSRICLGMMSYGDASTRDWHLDEGQAEPVVRRAVECGVTFFDTADAYSGGASERITGRLLAKLFTRRSEYVLATKVFYPTGPEPGDKGLSRRHILAAIDASLSRLGTDYVDLYQVHRWDDETPIAETMAALHDVVQSGKARFIGASSMYAWQFAKAQHAAETAGFTTFVSMQNHFNLVYREEEREMLPLCADQGVGVLPYSPLARGLLTGKRLTARSRNDPLADEMYDAADLDVVAAVQSVAADRGVAPAQVALAWLHGNAAVSSVVVGATKAGHVEDAVASVDLDLTTDERARLEAPYRPHRVLGHT